ncbi:MULTISPECIES: hypothetical protein [unclassified Micromonospora]
MPADGGEPVLNEVNTFPGFTAASQYRASGRPSGCHTPTC